jgi:KipI family sensor histidine kinase inhibitor
MSQEPRCIWIGEAALELRFGKRIDIETNARVHAAAHALTAARLPEVVELVPAYTTLTLVLRSAAALHADAFQSRVLAALRTGADATLKRARARVVTIPVAYGGEYGPDLGDLAAHAGLDVEEVVRRHTAPDYRVAMLGFRPGFPYLLGLDPALAMPRHATPRTRIAAGSVGIADAQTGIYPSASPGGWRLIGCTKVVLFDALSKPPTLLAPGDTVRFRAVSAKQLDSAQAEVGHA